MQRLAKTLGATYRDKERNLLVPQITRHLLKQQIKPSERRSDCIHPSEASHTHWCPRATYFRISGVEAQPMPYGIALEAVFETGNEAHRKYQAWLQQMGVLSGLWSCRNCGLRFLEVSPQSCPRCEVGDDLLVYAEVPVEHKDYLLAGNADADVIDKGLIEFKTIGMGTLRYEAPKFLARYEYHHLDNDGKEHVGIDWQALWQGIRRPFPSHLRQGMLYCFCAQRGSITFIYEPKFLTSAPKEFEVSFRYDFIEDILAKCKMVKIALEKRIAPKRPIWATPKHQACQRCPFRSTCWKQSTLQNN